jgi:hypothetical protein
MMRHLVPLAALLSVVGCAASSGRDPGLDTPATPAARRPPIGLKNNAEDERQTRAQLEGLFDRYDLSPWMLAPAIEIDRDAIPHSHPVLTLHTRHLRDDLLLLSTLIHEEGHWRFDRDRTACAAAVTALQTAFPDLPLGFPDGADTAESNYENLVVVAWEDEGMQRLVGELAARQVMEFWASDHYRALYRTVLDHRREVRAILRAQGLMGGAP